MYAQIYQKINKNNLILTQSVSLSAEEVRFIVENISPNEKKSFEKNIFSSIFNNCNLKKEDKALSTIDIFIKYKAYPILGAFLRKINSNGFSKIISKMMFFKYSESDLNKVFENMNNVSPTRMYMSVDRAVENIIRMDSLIYKKFLIRITASSYEHYLIIESLNSLYKSTSLTHFEAIEIIEKCNIDVNKIYFLKQRKKIPFFHYAYDNFNNILYNALFEKYGKDYNEKNENFETLEEYINKKSLGKENKNEKSSKNDSIERLQKIDENVKIDKIKRISNVRVNKNLLIFTSSDYYLKIDLNNEVEINFEEKNNIICLKNILGKYILQLIEEDYQRIKSIILNQKFFPEIKIESK